MKKIIVAGFVFLGIVLGLITVWFDQNTDTLFLLNVPGTLLGDAIYNISIELFGESHSAQAHYTIPWVLRVPQVYVLTSIILWGVIGFILTVLLKPRIIAWITASYLVIIGIVYLLVVVGLM